MNRRRRALTHSLVLTGVAGVLLLVFVGIDFDACKAGFPRLGLAYAGLAFAAYLGASVLRGTRLRVLIPPVTWSRLVSISFRHQFFATFLPLKTGEAALPIILKRHGVPMSRTLAVFALMRLLDLVGLLTVLSVAYLAAGGELPRELGGLGSVLVGIWVVVAVVTGVTLFGGRRIATALRSRVPRFLGRFGRIGAYVGRAFDAVLGAVLEIRPSRVVRALVVSLGVWAALATYGIVVFDRIVGSQPIAVWGVLCMFLSLGAQIPLQGFAGIGTTEALIVVLLASVGIDKEAALAAGVVIHAVQIVFCGAIGGLGFAVAAAVGVDDAEPSPAISRAARESAPPSPPAPRSGDASVPGT